MEIHTMINTEMFIALNISTHLDMDTVIHVDMHSVKHRHIETHTEIDIKLNMS